MEETTTEATVDSGEQTIQGVQVDDQGMAVSLPEETDTATADQPVTETASAEDSGAEALPDEDKLNKFAESHGLELDSPNAIKAAKMAMDNQAEYQRNRQKASELEKSIGTKSDQVADELAQQTGQDPELLRRLQRVEVKEAVRDFWAENPDAKQYESQMVAILQEKPHLAGDLESLYATALVKSGIDAAKSQGKREALQSLAHKQQAAVPTGNAVNSVVSPQTITPQNVDRLVAEHDVEWFRKNQDAINKAMAG